MKSYIEFKDGLSDSGKTKVITVWAKRNGELLGFIQWFGRWRQYAFFPRKDTVWSDECLDDIQQKIKSLKSSRIVGGE